MNKECLVTEYPIVTTNDNLPVLGKAFLDFVPYLTGGHNTELCIVTGETPVTIKVGSKIRLYDTESLINTYTVPANSYYLGTIPNKIGEEPDTTLNLPLKDTKDFIEISNYKSIKGFGLYRQVSPLRDVSTGKATSRNMLGSILQNNNVIAASIQASDIDKVGNNIKFIYIATDNADTDEHIHDISSLLKKPDIETIMLARPNGIEIGMINFDEDYSNSNVKVLMARPKGSVLNLPNNIMVFNGAAAITGSIEDMVNKMVASGRTQGTIAIVSPEWCYLTFDNKSIMKWHSEETPFEELTEEQQGLLSDTPVTVATNDNLYSTVVTWITSNNTTSIQFVRTLEQIPEGDDIKNYFPILPMSTWLGKLYSNQ